MCAVTSKESTLPLATPAESDTGIGQRYLEMYPMGNPCSSYLRQPSAHRFPTASFALALLVSILVLSLTDSTLGASMSCEQAEANLNRLQGELSADLDWLNRNCGSTDLPANLNENCQQAGPGMRAAVKNLQQEIGVAQQQRFLSCAPPTPAPARLSPTPFPALPPGPPIGLSAIEVTQAVQDMHESVPVIAGKQTWARVYLAVNPSTHAALTVTGTLVVNNPDLSRTLVTASAPVTVMPGVSLQQQRQSLNGSLNFKIPAAATTAGLHVFSLAGIYTATSAGSPTGPNICSCGDIKWSFALQHQTAVTFVGVPPLRLRIVPISYIEPHGNVISPRGVDIALLASWVTRAYPISTLLSTTAPPLTSTTPLGQLFGSGTGGCAATDSQLSVLRSTEINQDPNPIDPRTHYYGMVLVDPTLSSGLNGGYMRGCSPVPGFVGSGPTGPTSGVVPSNVSGDTDASFGDWYGGHEIGHSFGRYHPGAPGATTGFCGAGGPLDKAYPHPNGQISDNAGDTAGLDVGDANNGIPMTVIPGPTSFDIMSYCNQPQWLSDYTYERILSDPGGYGIEQQDPSGNGPPRPARTFTVSGKFVSVVATINLSKRVGRFDFVQTVNRAPLVTFRTQTQAALAYVSADGKMSAQYSVNVQTNSEALSGEDVTALVDATIPYSATATKLELLLDGKLFDQRTISKTFPVVRGVVLKTPGTFTWQTSSGQPGRLTFYVQGRPKGQSWETIALGLSKPRLQLSAAQRRRYVQLRVIANDGFHNSLPVEVDL